MTNSFFCSFRSLLFLILCIVLLGSIRADNDEEPTNNDDHLLINNKVEKFASSDGQELISQNDAKNGEEICELSVSVGDCSRELKRYYFDSSTNRCRRFTYSGCGGNLNRFVTLRRCKLRCYPEHRKRPRKRYRVRAKLNNAVPMRDDSAAHRRSLTCAEDTDCGGGREVGARCVNGRCRCSNGGLELANGTCIDVNECEWEPCVGHSFCVNVLGSLRCECRSGYAGSGFNCTRNEKVCLEMFDSRYEKQCYPGQAKQIRYFYDLDSGACRPFDHGGCQFGNSRNIFGDRESCESVCQPFLRDIISGPFRVTTVSSVLSASNDAVADADANRTQQQQQLLDGGDAEVHVLTTTERAADLTNVFPNSVCLEPPDQSLFAPCSNGKGFWRRRFYFDSHAKTCRFFWHDISCREEDETRNRLKTHENMFRELSDCQSICERRHKHDGGGTAGVIQVTLTSDEDEAARNRVETSYKTKDREDEERREPHDNRRPVSHSSSTSPQNDRDAYKVVQGDDCGGVDVYTEIFPLGPKTLSTRQQQQAVIESERQKTKSFSQLDLCREPFHAGVTRACSGGERWQNRWFFDAELNACRPFWYDDCPLEGLRNFFTDFRTCLEACVEGGRRGVNDHDKNGKLEEFKTSEYALPDFGGAEEPPASQQNKAAMERRYLNSGEMPVDHTQCTGFRFGLRDRRQVPAQVKLVSYLCLMEEGGGCQMQPFHDLLLAATDAGEDDACYSSHSWMHGRHLYAWYFTLQKHHSASSPSSSSSSTHSPLLKKRRRTTTGVSRSELVLSVVKPRGENESLAIPFELEMKRWSASDSRDDDDDFLIEHGGGGKGTVSVIVLPPGPCEEVCPATNKQTNE